MGQESYRPSGTVFLRRDYRALSERWEHEHCEMCMAKFMDATYSATHAQFIEDHPDVLMSGLVTDVRERRKERWVCEECFADFADELGWVLVAP